MAVPGPVTSPMSAGCHELLRREDDPALLVTSVDDVLAVVGSSARACRATTAPVRRRPRRARPARPVARARVRRAAGPTVRPPGRGRGAQRRRPLDVIRALPALDEAGLIERDGTGLRISSRVRAMNRPP